MSIVYDHPRPGLTVDCVVFAVDDEELRVLLIQRRFSPFSGDWALPGGFVRPGESLDEAARRELQEETGVKRVYLEQLYTFGALDRDPRDRIVTVAYYALVRRMDHHLKAATDAANAAWFALDDLPKVAFDHPHIIKVAHERLRGKVRYQPVGFELLPSRFTLRQLQRLYEMILDRDLDKRNFRRKILGMEILVGLEEFETDVSHRAARLYRFDRQRYRQLVKEGFNFEL